MSSRIDRANACHGAVRGAEQTTLTAAYACGEHLVKAKAAVGHGNFRTMVLDKLSFGERIARHYMEVFRRWDAIQAKMRTDPDEMRCLSDAIRFVRESLQAERKPKTDVEVRPGEEDPPAGGATIPASALVGSKTEIISVLATPGVDYSPVVTASPNRNRKVEPAHRPLVDCPDAGRMSRVASLPPGRHEVVARQGHKVTVIVPEPDRATKLEDIQAEHDARRAAVDNLPDEEWLATLPLSRALLGEPLELFRRDAVLFRRVAPEVAELKRAVARSAGVGVRRLAYGWHLSAFLSTAPPDRWQKCPPLPDGGCDGTGTSGFDDDKCPKCWGRGYSTQASR